MGRKYTVLKVNFGKINTILCLGAHPDDIEIGCGGTILKLLAGQNTVTVHWIVFSTRDNRASETLQSADIFLRDAKNKDIVQKNFQDTFFPHNGTEIKEYFIELRREISPDMVFTPRLEDRHQDHRLVSELTWNTFRDHLILEYEIPKYEGDLGQPNVFVTLEKETSALKIQTILSAFSSQKEKQWFTDDTFWAMLRLRGLESKSPSGFAEGLYFRKMVI